MSGLSASLTTIASALALLAAWPAAAQEAGGVDRILAQMPKKLDGAPAVNSSNGILMYIISEPGGKLTMIVAVAVVEKEGFVSPEELRGRALEMVKDFGMRQVIREGRFATPRWPVAPTYFGEYVTDKGFTQSWNLVTGKEAMNVTTVFAKRKDAGRAEALVAGKILGGAVISASKPAE